MRDKIRRKKVMKNILKDDLGSSQLSPGVDNVNEKEEEEEEEEGEEESGKAGQELENWEEEQAFFIRKSVKLAIKLFTSISLSYSLVIPKIRFKYSKELAKHQAHYAENKHRQSAGQKAKIAKLVNELKAYDALENTLFADEEFVNILIFIKNDGIKDGKVPGEPNVYLTYLKTKAFLCLLTFPEKYVNVNVEASDKLKIVSNAYDQIKDPFYEYILLSMVDYFCGKHDNLKIHY
jgi:hypothetical protein